MILSVSRRTDIPAFYGEWFRSCEESGKSKTGEPDCIVQENCGLHCVLDQKSGKFYEALGKIRGLTTLFSVYIKWIRKGNRAGYPAFHALWLDPFCAIRFEFFSIVSSRLWKGLLPTMKKNYRRRRLLTSIPDSVWTAGLWTRSLEWRFLWIKIKIKDQSVDVPPALILELMIPAPTDVSFAMLT